LNVETLKRFEQVLLCLYFVQNLTQFMKFVVARWACIFTQNYSNYRWTPTGIENHFQTYLREMISKYQEISKHAVFRMGIGKLLIADSRQIFYSCDKSFISSTTV